MAASRKRHAPSQRSISRAHRKAKGKHASTGERQSHRPCELEDEDEYAQRKAKGEGREQKDRRPDTAIHKADQEEQKATVGSEDRSFRRRNPEP